MSDRPKPEQLTNLPKNREDESFLGRFINTDMKSIRDSWIEERFMPGIYDLGQFLWDKLWEKGGKSTVVTRSSLNKGNNKTNYTSFSSTKIRFQRADGSIDYNEISKPRYDQIMVETRDEAIQLAQSMNDYISQYKEVDRGNLYTMIGITGDDVDAKWGWRLGENWDTPSFKRVPGGYLMIFSKIKYLD